MDDWYAPPKKKFSKKTIALIAAGVVLLAAVVVLAVRGTGVFPSSELTPKIPEITPDYPDDFKDYLDDFYTSETNDEVSILMPLYEGTITERITTRTPTEQELTLQELYRTCSPAIVTVTASEDGVTESSWGSGIILSENGLLLTNTHVINGCTSAFVTTDDGTEYDVKLIGADAVSDVAVLKVLTEDKLPYVELGDSTKVKTGDAVAAIGSPLGPTFHNTLTDGIISAVERGLTYNGHELNLLQTNVALNEGNSGGALFNRFGQVIGITNMKMMSVYSSIEGIGFAIPSETVAVIAQELINTGTVKRALIGITVGSVPKNVQSYYELPSGLYVSAVTPGSGADKAGIQAGDIITEVNGNPVTQTSEVNEVKDQLLPGDTMTFTIYRDGKTLEAVVVLTEQK